MPQDNCASTDYVSNGSVEPPSALVLESASSRPDQSPLGSRRLLDPEVGSERQQAGEQSSSGASSVAENVTNVNYCHNNYYYGTGINYTYFIIGNSRYKI